MKGNLSKCLDIMLRHEGGFSNNPEDPGGMTNLGVTKRTYEAWKGKNYKATEADMRALTKKDVEPIYEKNYWNAVKGDDLPKGLDLCVFDFGVNAGPGTAVKTLQMIIGSPADGIISTNTLKKLKEHKVEDIIKEYQAKRLEYYQSRPHFKKYGRGWTRRVEETTTAARNMV